MPTNREQQNQLVTFEADQNILRPPTAQEILYQGRLLTELSELGLITESIGSSPSDVPPWQYTDQYESNS
jgi:hypothetical protein